MKSYENPDQYLREGVMETIWGGRGKVQAAFLPNSHRQLAIKRYFLEKCSNDFRLIGHETQMLRQLQHPNICTILYSLTYKDEVWLVMPRHICSCSALLIGRYAAGLPELAVALIVRDTLQALSYMHQRGVVHRGIQGRHLLVNSDGQCVVSGLRSCAALPPNGGQLYDFPPHPKPLLNWASPEILQQDMRGYGRSSDVYSLGLTVCELINAEQPYQGIEASLMMVEKLRGLVPYLHDSSTLGDRDLSPSGSCSSLNSNGGIQLSSGSSSVDTKVMSQQQSRTLSAGVHGLIRACLALEPWQRPTARDLLLSHAFVRTARKANTSHGLLAVIHSEELNAASAVRCDDDSTEDLETSLAQTSLQEEDTGWAFEE